MPSRIVSNLRERVQVQMVAFPCFHAAHLDDRHGIVGDAQRAANLCPALDRVGRLSWLDWVINNPARGVGEH
jgi:hypothetical protein